MKQSDRNSDALLLKRAKDFDAAAARAEVRRLRAVSNGSQREADGARNTIAEAEANARHLRSQIGQRAPAAAKGKLA